MSTAGNTTPTFTWKRDLYVAIGNRFRELRIEHNMSTRQVAERIGTAYGTLAKLESGALPAPVYVLVQIAELFDTTLDDLVPLVNVVLNEPKEAVDG